MADWQPIETCPRTPGVKYDFWVEQLVIDPNVYTFPPKRYTDCELLPPEVYRDAYQDLNQVHIDLDNWKWWCPEFGTLNEERFKILYWMPHPTEPV